MFDRRQLLAGAASLPFVAAFIPPARAAGVPKAPVARVAVVTDSYFGETLADPYRWMENDKDPGWLPYLKGQDAHTRAVLGQLSTRPALLNRIEQLSGDTVATSDVQRAGGLTFYQQRPLGADNYKLFVREADGTARVLVDPTTRGGATGHVSLDWWEASPDGRHVAYGLSADGSEDSVLHVLTVVNGRDLPERIADTRSANPQWIDDSSGFFYTQLTGKLNTPERYLDARARFHRLGGDPAADPILMQRGRVAGVDYDRIQAPYPLTTAGSPYLVLALADVRPELRLYVAQVSDAASGRARWTQIARFEDEVIGVALEGDALYLLTTRDHPRGRIVRTSAAAPDLKTAAEVVPQGPLVIEAIYRARDGIYLRLMDGGVSRLRKLATDGRVVDIALPFEGTIGAVHASPEQDGVLLRLSGWLQPTGLWAVDAGGRVSDTGLTPRPAIDVAGFESVRHFATAKDGTKIPYSLIHKRGLKLDGSAPAYVSAYGSYGAAAYTPAFQGRALALIEAGCVVGYANVRGGGEYGRAWHRAGQLANKPNTWRDLIAVCEDMVAKGYTKPQRLAIGGRSAGGIAVGRAMTERPDLFAAVVSGVGWSNPIRYVVEPNGYGEEPEWGAIREEAGYRALKSIDSYHAVRDGVKYPAVLLTTGVTDPQVAPFHVAKMTARLQAASGSGRPVLMRVDFDAGHGIGSTRAQQDRETADTYAFILWATGLRG